ncbi:Uncharacterised protein [Vibrio cholerae]|nr:Uncharacterised protein [Vibrio cholerae]
MFDAFGVTHRHSGFNHHDGLWIDRQHIINHRFHGSCIKMIGLWVIVGRRGDHDKLCVLVGVSFIASRSKIKGLML